METDEQLQARKVGRETRESLFGSEAVRQREPSDRVADFVGEISDDANWGRIWSRPGLDLKTRSMCVIVALAVQDQWDYARLHVLGARNIGVTRSELVELAAQLMFYATLSRTHHLLRLIDEVYAVSNGEEAS